MSRTEPRPPMRMSEATLAEAALAYLSRYATSSGNLRRVLHRKIMRSARHYGDDPAPLLSMIDALVAEYARAGAVNDALYADAQVRTLRRRGGSARAILQRLAGKGVPSELIRETASSLSEAAGDPAAAMLFARRRRLGPYRAAGRAECRQRDIAALGRAGFDYATAATVVDAADPDTLARIISER